MYQEILGVSKIINQMYSKFLTRLLGEPKVLENRVAGHEYLVFHYDPRSPKEMTWL